jgi:hypothetical protein
MEENNNTELLIDSVSHNVDGTLEMVTEEYVMIDQSETVDPAVAQQYSTYCIDLSHDIETRVSTGSMYNLKGMLPTPSTAILDANINLRYL